MILISLNNPIAKKLQKVKNLTFKKPDLPNKIASLATLACLCLGYPIAYAIWQAPRLWRPFLLLLIILPFWTSVLVRIYAWIGLLSAEGVINSFLKN